MTKKISPNNKSKSSTKIISYREAVAKIRANRDKGLGVLLVIGGFDVIHIGHIEYLRQSKQRGDMLFVGLENDETLRTNKGPTRPFNKLDHRLEVLSEFNSVDYVFGFEGVPTYNKGGVFVDRFRELNPSLLVSSSWDPTLEVKKRVAKEAGVKMLILEYPAQINSSTNLLKLIGYE